MQLHYTERFRRSCEDAPTQIRRTFDRRVVLLVQNPRHPSLRARKYDEVRDIWQARVNEGWRFYFKIGGDVYYLIDIVPHPK